MKLMKKIHTDVYVGIAMIGLAVFFLWGASLIKVNVSRVVPRLYGYCLIGLSVLLIIDGIFKSIKASNGTGSPLPIINKTEVFWGLATWVVLFAYYLLFKYIGFFPATIIFMIGSMLALKQRNWKVIAITVTSVLGVIYIVFVQLLNVKLI